MVDLRIIDDLTHKLSETLPPGFPTHSHSFFLPAPAPGYGIMFRHTIMTGFDRRLRIGWGLRWFTAVQGWA